VLLPPHGQKVVIVPRGGKLGSILDDESPTILMRRQYAHGRARLARRNAGISHVINAQESAFAGTTEQARAAIMSADVRDGRSSYCFVIADRALAESIMTVGSDVSGMGCGAGLGSTLNSQHDASLARSNQS